MREEAFAVDPDGRTRRVIPIRVEDCPCPVLLNRVRSFDLFGLSEDEARSVLLDSIHAAVDGRGKPPAEPLYPGIVIPPACTTRSQPRFPGDDRQGVVHIVHQAGARVGSAGGELVGKRLADLLRAATVQLHGDSPGTGGALGMGFFVTPRIVATCAHVVADESDRLPETVVGRIVASEPGGADRDLVFETVAEWYLRDGEGGGPDLAFLRAPAAEDVAPVVLSGVVEVGDALGTFGHPAVFPGGQPALFTVHGPSLTPAVSGDWDPERAVETRDGGGYDGSPVLSHRTGAVAGMLCTSDPAGSARMVAASEILRALREIVDVQEDPSSQAAWLGALDDEQIRAGGWRFPGPTLRDYLEAAAGAAAKYPFLGLLPEIKAPPLRAVYLRQSVRSAALDRDGGKPTGEVEDLVPSDAILEHAEDCVVVAGPGMGKSSLLRTMLINLAEQWLDTVHAGAFRSAQDAAGVTQDGSRQVDGTSVPRFVPVRVIAADLLGSASMISARIAAGVNTELGDHGQDKERLASLFAVEPLAGVRWLVLVDGLDEVFDPEARRRVQQIIRGAARGERPGPYRFVVATRPLPGWELAGESALDPATRYYELLPFGPSDLVPFAEGWFRTLGRPDDPREAARVFGAAVGRSPLAVPALTPLIATILCQLFSEHPDELLPSGLAEAYAKFIDLLRRRWMRERLPDNADGKADGKDVAAAALVRESAVAAGARVLDRATDLLTRLAVERFEGRGTPAVELFTQWTREDRPARVSAAVWTDFLRDVLRRSGILVERAGDFAFLHYTIIEYLAANHTAADPRRSDAAFAAVLGRWERRWPYSGFWSRKRAQRIVGFCVPERSRFWLRRSWRGPAWPQDSYYGFLVTAWRGRPDLVPTLLHIIARTKTDGARFVVALVKQAAVLDPAVVEAAGDALARIATKPCAEPEHPFGLSTNGFESRLRFQAAFSVWEIGDARAPDLFAALAADTTLNLRFRVYAAETLSDMADGRGADLLAALAVVEQTAERKPTRTEVRTRWRAAVAAARRGDRRGADELAARAADPASNTLRWGSAAVLLEVGDPRATGLLLALADDESVYAGERMHVSAFLAVHGDAEDAARFAAFADGAALASCDIWRWFVMKRLMGDPGLTAVLDELAVTDGREVFTKDDQPHSVRRRADQALAGLLGAEAVVAFLILAKNEAFCWDFPWPVAAALARHDDGPWLSALMSLVADPALAHGHRLVAAAVLKLVVGEAQARHMYAALEKDCTLDHENRFRASLVLISLGVPHSRGSWRDPCTKRTSRFHAVAEEDTAGSAALLAKTFAAAFRPEGPPIELGLAEKALEASTRLFGAADRETLAARNRLATTRAVSEGSATALPLYEGLLQDAVRELGEADRLTLTVLGNVAKSRHGAGDLDGALPLYQRALATTTKEFGDLDADTLAARFDLAWARMDSGDAVQAVAMFDQTYADRLRVQGAEHRDSMAARYMAGYARSRAGVLDEATALYEQILPMQRSILGENDADTLSTVDALAVAYQQSGQLTEAFALLETTLEGLRQAFGENDSRTLNASEALEALRRTSAE